MPDFIEIQGNGQTVTPSLAQAFERFPAAGATAVRSEMTSTAGRFKARMKSRSSEGPLFRRSNRAFNSWSDNVGGSRLADITGVVGSFVFYMRDHDEGGTFTPKKAFWFWIPMGPNLNAKRRARVSISRAQQLIESGEWRFASRARGSTDRTLFGKSAAVINENNEIVYILTRSKTLKPVLKFLETGDEFERGLVAKLFSDFDDYWARNP